MFKFQDLIVIGARPRDRAGGATGHDTASPARYPRLPSRGMHS
jgi:hypothetical protein